MSISVWLAMTSSATARWFKPSTVLDPDSILDIAYATTASTAAAPYTVTLFEEEYDVFGDLVSAPAAVASYKIPAADPTTTATFDFAYTDFSLSNTSRAVFWTQAGAFTSAATDVTTLEMQLYNTSGAKVGAPKALALAGTQTGIADLSDIGFASAVDFGASFMVAYSTFNPSTKASTIHYEEFTTAGAAVRGGLLYSVNDGTKHGITFGSYFTPQGTHTPAYMLLYRLPQGATSALHVQTLTATGGVGPFNFDYQLFGPAHQDAIALDSFGFSRPSTIDPDGDYGVLSETFRYKDSSAVTHEQIALETLSATGAITATTEFADVAGTATSVHIVHVGGGDIVVGYNDGTSCLIKEFSASLVQIGATVSLADATGDLTDLTSLGDGRFEAEWRQDLTSTSSILHTEIFDTRAPGVTINLSAQTTPQSIAGTAGDDTLIGGSAADVIEGVAGNDTLEGKGGDDTLIGGAGVNILDGGAGADRLDGTGGTSTASYADATAAVRADLLVPASNTGDAAGDTYIDIHRLLGSNFNDVLIGDNSGDVISGGAGNDTIVGGAGADTLFGGAGADVLTGGAGADRFEYTAASQGGDTITDFSTAQGDTFLVSHTGFGGGLPASGTLDAGQFVDGTAATAATGQFLWNSATSTLSWDADGTGAGAAVEIAKLTGVTTLTAAAIRLF